MTTATVAGSTTPTVHSAGSTVRPDTPTAGPDTPTMGPDTPMVHPDTPTVRPATPADIPAICEIYGWEVRNRAATFELVPPDAAEMRARMAGCGERVFRIWSPRRGTTRGGWEWEGWEWPVSLMPRRIGRGRGIGLRWRIRCMFRATFSGGGSGSRC